MPQTTLLLQLKKYFEPVPVKGTMNCLSRMRGNFHVRFGKEVRDESSATSSKRLSFFLIAKLADENSFQAVGWLRSLNPSVLVHFILEIACSKLHLTGNLAY